MQRFFPILMVVLFVFSVSTFAQDADRFGPFSALVIDEGVIQDVVTEGNDIYVKVSEEYRDREFAVKISDENMARYRNWQDGGPVMRVKVYRTDAQGKQGYTYRINTTAPYVEFWMGEKLILHLNREQ